MKKPRSKYVCQSCGYESHRWMGKCPECESWNCFIEEQVVTASKKSIQRETSSPPVPITDIPEKEHERIRTGISEVDRVLGGGILPGSVILVAGAPGLGKSTLLLQIGDALAQNSQKILYVSGEESLNQIKMRARRLSIEQKSFLLLTETNVDAIIQTIKNEKPDLVVIDSIQTVYNPQLESLPGNVSQVRFCGHQLTQIAKENQIPIFFIGHVTKDGHIAGPRVLEHLIDGLLMLEGDDQHLYRILRAVKNRFGSTNEVGLFEMSEKGLLEVSNPSEYLISQRQQAMSGTVITVSMEGSRPLLVEVQALVTPTSYGIPQRTATGIEQRRMSILLAVLEKRLGLRFGTQDVFVNTSGGLRLREPAVDLAVAMAIVSSRKEKPLNAKTAVVGEIGLTGEVRGISHLEKRVSEAERLGFSHMVVPKRSLNSLNKKATQLTGVETVHEAVQILGL